MRIVWRLVMVAPLLAVSLVPPLSVAGSWVAPAVAAAPAQPAGAAAWRAEGLPDPPRAAPAEVARFFATVDPARRASLAARYPELLTNLDGAPLDLRLGVSGGRRLLYDPRGDGRIAEVVGDLAAARRIVVLVPGVDTTLANFHRGLGGVARRAPAWQAAQLYAQVRRLTPGAAVAVVAWLGYDPPEGLGRAAARRDRAAAGAVALERFVAGLAVQRPGASVVLVGHSYGALVVGLAAPRLDPAVTDLVALGAPGMGVRRAAHLRTSARVWAGRAPGDWTRWLPGVRVGGLGLGRAPTDPRFGARPLPASDVDGHDGYFEPGTRSLEALAWIALAG